jgi:hypothetical protein
MPMKKILLIAAALASWSLAAGAFEKPESDQIAQAKMIGLPERTVRACLGPPTWRRGVGATEIWSYGSGKVRIEGSGFASVGYPRHSLCRVSIVMTNGTVSRIFYSGFAGDSLDLGERCLFPVDDCVRR